MIDTLEAAIAADNAEAVQDAIFALGKFRGTDGMLPDELALQLLAILRRQESWQSTVAGHVLNFFEFEAPRLSQNAKDFCLAFLHEWGSRFTDIHSVQVVGELLHGPYLKPIPPKPPRSKPRWSSEQKRRTE